MQVWTIKYASINTSRNQLPDQRTRCWPTFVHPNSTQPRAHLVFTQNITYVYTCINVPHNHADARAPLARPDHARDHYPGWGFPCLSGPTWPLPWLGLPMFIGSPGLPLPTTHTHTHTHTQIYIYIYIYIYIERERERESIKGAQSLPIVREASAVPCTASNQSWPHACVRGRPPLATCDSYLMVDPKIMVATNCMHTFHIFMADPLIMVIVEVSLTCTQILYDIFILTACTQKLDGRYHAKHKYL
jgi:hypothetical protein